MPLLLCVCCNCNKSTIIYFWILASLTSIHENLQIVPVNLIMLGTNSALLHTAYFVQDNVNLLIWSATTKCWWVNYSAQMLCIHFLLCFQCDMFCCVALQPNHSSCFLFNYQIHGLFSEKLIKYWKSRNVKEIKEFKNLYLPRDLDPHQYLIGSSLIHVSYQILWKSFLQFLPNPANSQTRMQTQAWLRYLEQHPVEPIPPQRLNTRCKLNQIAQTHRYESPKCDPKGFTWEINDKVLCDFADKQTKQQTNQ